MFINVVIIKKFGVNLQFLGQFLRTHEFFGRFEQEVWNLIKPILMEQITPVAVNAILCNIGRKEDCFARSKTLYRSKVPRWFKMLKCQKENKVVLTH